MLYIKITSYNNVLLSLQIHKLKVNKEILLNNIYAYFLDVLKSDRTAINRTDVALVLLFKASLYFQTVVITDLKTTTTKSGKKTEKKVNCRDSVD